MTREVEGEVQRPVEGGAFLAHWQNLPQVFPSAVERGYLLEAAWMQRAEEAAAFRGVRDMTGRERAVELMRLVGEDTA